jgi:hypothetical protein
MHDGEHYRNNLDVLVAIADRNGEDECPDPLAGVVGAFESSRDVPLWFVIMAPRQRAPYVYSTSPAYPVATSLANRIAWLLETVNR